MEEKGDYSTIVCEDKSPPSQSGEHYGEGKKTWGKL